VWLLLSHALPCGLSPVFLRVPRGKDSDLANTQTFATVFDAFKRAKSLIYKYFSYKSFKLKDLAGISP
jgi:hypothetical protein